MAEVTPITKLPAPQVTPFSMAFVTISNQDEAQKLAKKIVQTKLAACVNIVPKIISVYEWKGNVENDSESLMMIKTRSSRVEELIEFVRKHHPYEVCEVISTPIQQGNPAYLEWLGNYVGDKDKEETCG
ncbi:cutA-like precursor [Leptotrombidium deliense]|uniref:CutA-like n=1 Tax=Leptotrombidium deliense TaxID=299467 RepID=A0A443RWP8_9ACAR|nr:cutA-like precursor [Leptotrombidium deliense]